MSFTNVSQDIKEEFLELWCDLSPENLSCDGELSIDEVKQRRQGLLTRWSALERRVGRQVSDDEVNRWAIEAGEKQPGRER